MIRKNMLQPLTVMFNAMHTRAKPLANICEVLEMTTPIQYL
jgi:hypothetical protein